MQLLHNNLYPLASGNIALRAYPDDVEMSRTADLAAAGRWLLDQDYFVVANTAKQLDYTKAVGYGWSHRRHDVGYTESLIELTARYYRAVALADGRPVALVIDDIQRIATDLLGGGHDDRVFADWLRAVSVGVLAELEISTGLSFKGATGIHPRPAQATLVVAGMRRRANGSLMGSAQLVRLATSLLHLGHPQLAEGSGTVVATYHYEKLRFGAAGRRPLFCGTTARRQSVGDPGHCERCVKVGHVAAHPDLGCGDVGCNQAHGPEDEPAHALYGGTVRRKIGDHDYWHEV